MTIPYKSWIMGAAIVAFIGGSAWLLTDYQHRGDVIRNDAAQHKADLQEIVNQQQVISSTRLAETLQAKKSADLATQLDAALSAKAKTITIREKEIVHDIQAQPPVSCPGSDPDVLWRSFATGFNSVSAPSAYDSSSRDDTGQTNRP